MKNINTIKKITNNIVTCEECGCIIAEGQGTEFNGSMYCEDCIDEVSFECSYCGTRVSTDEEVHTVDGRVCDECFCEHYIVCEECGEVVRRYDSHYVDFNDTYICDDCRLRRYVRCENCGELFPDGDLNPVFTNRRNSESWCDGCVEDHALYCNECNEYYDTRYVSFEDDMCEYCIDESSNQEAGDIDEWHAPRGIKNYSYKPNPCFCPKEAENEICLGFELEMEYHGEYGVAENEDADYMNDSLGFTYCKHDGSLEDDLGIELVSHPATLQYLMDRKDLFKKTFDTMRKKGYTSHNNGNCGLHFHISHKPMVEKNIHAVSALLIMVDELWDKLLVFSRRTEYQLNRWARRYNTKGKESIDLDKVAKRECERYVAVNLQNTHTVEIRIFRGSLLTETFLATAQLVQRLVDVAIEFKNPEDAHNVSWDHIINDCDYEELKAYCKKRFGSETEENDALKPDKPQGPAPTNTPDEATLIEFHRRNLRVGDIVTLTSTCSLPSEYREQRFVVNELGETFVIINPAEEFSRNGRVIPPDAPFVVYYHEIVRYNTEHVREGDYVRIRLRHSDYRTECFATGHYDYGFSENIQAGWVGRICNTYAPNVGVEFLAEFYGAHDCGGDGARRRCQWIPVYNLEFV